MLRMYIVYTPCCQMIVYVAAYWRKWRFGYCIVSNATFNKHPYLDHNKCTCDVYMLVIRMSIMCVCFSGVYLNM